MNRLTQLILVVLPMMYLASAQALVNIDNGFVQCQRIAADEANGDEKQEGEKKDDKKKDGKKKDGEAEPDCD